MTPEQIAALIAQAQATESGAPAPQAQAGSGWADKIADAEDVNDAGQYFSAGNYTLAISELKAVAKHDGGESFVGEFTVIESDNPLVKVGEVRSWVAPIEGKNSKMGRPEVKKFALMLVEQSIARGEDKFSASDTLSQALHKMTSGVCKGDVVKLNAWTKKTQAGNDFTKHKWLPA